MRKTARRTPPVAGPPAPAPRPRTTGLTNLTTAHGLSRASCVDYGAPVLGPVTGATRSGATRRAVARDAHRRSVRRPAREGVARTPPTAVAGAVRLSAVPGTRLRHVGKVSAVLLFAAGGILATTASTGTVERAPRVVTDADRVVAPAFFFDDAQDALAAASAAQAALRHEADELDTPATIGSVPVVADGGLPTGTVAAPSATGAVPVPPPLALEALRARLDAPEDATVESVVVAAGDTLSGILNARGIKVEHMPKLLADKTVQRHLGTLRIGQTFEITRRADGSFHSFSAKLGEESKLSIRRADTGFAVAAVDLPVEKERVVSSGTIATSLYDAAKEANLKRSTIMELADIFQWELDFSRDIRAGDAFSVVYDRLYREGRYIGDGDILAAEFVRGGKTHRAVRFTTADGLAGYYAPDGSSKKRAFLRHPVDVARVTSKFNPNRMHPVLGTRRPHRGVDYGAPHGSPIFAAADGTVKYAGKMGAYGNVVVVRHGERIETLYAHMSSIDGISTKGAKVRQGDVIGYVGRTGRVTGTHLHYEFRKDGEHVDPLTVRLPGAEPLAPEYRADLATVSERLMAQMRAVLPRPDTVAAAFTAEGATVTESSAALAARAAD